MIVYQHKVQEYIKINITLLISNNFVNYLLKDSLNRRNKKIRSENRKNLEKE